MTRSDSTVEERLRAALNVDLADLHDGVDMSGAAVAARLRDACEMSSLCIQLAAADSESRSQR